VGVVPSLLGKAVPPPTPPGFGKKGGGVGGGANFPGSVGMALSAGLSGVS